MSQRCRCPYIALLGVDGAGKSSVADEISERCLRHGVGTTHYHWRPRVLSIRKLNSPEIGDMPPYRGSLRNPMLSIFILLFAFLDFLAGYHFRIRKEIQRGNLVLHERYFYDVIFDPHRYNLKIPRGLALRLSRSLPKPDLVVLLIGDPMAIAHRKEEVGILAVEQMQTEMANNLPGLARVFKVDTTRAKPKSIACTILEEVSREFTMMRDLTDDCP